LITIIWLINTSSTAQGAEVSKMANHGSTDGRDHPRPQTFLALVQEIFAKDAHEIMQIMVQHFKAGFAADDQTREYIHEAKQTWGISCGSTFP